MKRLGSERYQTTLSIGVGVDKEIETARRYARMGVDLALGRGGDQAVVKTKDAQKFFGGMSTSVENTTRVRARLTAYALKELIEASDRVLIMGHANPDLDEVAHVLRSGRYSEAEQLLNRIPSHDADWHALYARAEIALGNRISALDHARAAVRMSPGDPEYQQLLSEIESGSRAYRQRI